MATRLFQVNDELNAVIVFTNKLTGALADPTTVTVKLSTPDAVTHSYVYLTNGEVTKISTGVYRFLVVLVLPGHYFIRAEGTGTIQGSIETEFDVDSTEF